MDMPTETCLIFIDVKKAHFWSPARRRLLVELPPEAGYPSDKVGLLKKSLYGTRDAPANWEAAIKEVMLKLNFVQARSNSCLYFREGFQISMRGSRRRLYSRRPKGQVTMVCRCFEEILDH